MNASRWIWMAAGLLALAGCADDGGTGGEGGVGPHGGLSTPPQFIEPVDGAFPPPDFIAGDPATPPQFPRSHNSQ